MPRLVFMNPPRQLPSPSPSHSRLGEGLLLVVPPPVPHHAPKGRHLLGPAAAVPDETIPLPALLRALDLADPLQQQPRGEPLAGGLSGCQQPLCDPVGAVLRLEVRDGGAVPELVPLGEVRGAQEVVPRGQAEARQRGGVQAREHLGAVALLAALGAGGAPLVVGGAAHVPLGGGQRLELRLVGLVVLLGDQLLGGEGLYNV
jgi:hypothetical protein